MIPATRPREVPDRPVRSSAAATGAHLSRWTNRPDQAIGRLFRVPQRPHADPARGIARAVKPGTGRNRRGLRSGNLPPDTTRRAEPTPGAARSRREHPFGRLMSGSTTSRPVRSAAPGPALCVIRTGEQDEAGQRLQKGQTP